MNSVSELCEFYTGITLEYTNEFHHWDRYGHHRRATPFGGIFAGRVRERT